MSEAIEVRTDELTGPVLEALRRHALENLGMLSPQRLPDMARRLVEGFVRFAINGDGLAAEEIGRQCATTGLVLSSFLAAGRALSKTFSLQGETREDAVARSLLVADFIGGALFGIRMVAFETFRRQRDTLEQALQEAASQEHESLRRVIRELSTPVVPLADRVLLLPLVGAIDLDRSSLIMERLLEATFAHRAEVVLLDVTGVPSIEADVAVRLFAGARSARLLGAQVIVVGLSPDFARSLVGLGVDAGDILTLGSVQCGLEHVVRRRAVRSSASRAG